MQIRLKLLPLFFLLNMLAGCAGMPQNPEEFRKSARTAPSMFNKARTFNVARPFNEVSATLRKRSSECLNFSYEWHNSKGKHGVVTFKPTFLADKAHAELHIQEKGNSATIVVGGVPKDGLYHIVLDATPITPNSTRIDLFVSSSVDDRLLINTVTDWVKGTNLSCPDFT